ncbi:MAG TPA: efflux RND transporter periplasmic adaptor subunit [Rhodocyclaceae bacterium]|nr:efflux RND transporter periplasmic adaptor subunit [Rhodocyclaceae bacterium]
MKLKLQALEARFGRKQFRSIVAVLSIGAALSLLILVGGNRASEQNKAYAEQSDSKGESQKPDHSTDGLVTLSDEQIESAGIEIQAAAPAKIRTTLQLPGEIRFNEDRTAHIVPRMAGVAEIVPANLGQLVKKGDVLAVLASADLSDRRSELLTAQKRRDLARITYEREKKLWQDKISAEQDYLQAQQTLREADIAVTNAQEKLLALGAATQSKGPLNRYEIRAPFDGMVIEKHISLGEAVKEDSNIFTVSDLSTVWAEIVVSAKDLNAVHLGERVKVKATAFDSEAEGSISFVGALLGQETRTATARVTLPNPQVAWRPGLFVNIEVSTGETEAIVAVPNEAIQMLDGTAVVFIRNATGFKAQPVETGRTDGKMTEIIKGLTAGAPCAVSNSFTLKAELGKSSVEHDD